MVPDVSKERIAHITGSLGCEWKGNTILRNKTFRKRVLPTLPDLSVVNVKAILYSETRRFESAHCPHYRISRSWMERQYYTPKQDVSKARIAHITGSLCREWKGNTILRNKTFRKRVLPTLPDLSVVNVKAILCSETRRFDSAYCPQQQISWSWMGRQYYTPKQDVSKARIAHISGSLGRECEGNTILRNVGKHSSKDTYVASHTTGFLHCTFVRTSQSALLCNICYSPTTRSQTIQMRSL